MSSAPDITKAVKSSGISQAEAERLAGLNARTVKKIFDGNNVSERSEEKMRAGLLRYGKTSDDINSILRSEFVSNRTKLFDGVDDPEDALALLRAFRTGFDDFVRRCMDKDLGFTRSDAGRFAFEIDGLNNSITRLTHVAEQRGS